VLDLARVPVSDLARGNHLTLSPASLLVFGQDDRALVAPLSLERHCRAATEACFRSMLELRPGVKRLRSPLDYPDPTGHFYGYDMPELATAHSRGVPSTRRLVSLACRISTALLVLEHGNIACTKAESVELYVRVARDQWADLVSEIYGRCKMDWSYRIPELPHEQDALRRLCCRVPALECHSLETFQARTADLSDLQILSLPFGQKL
jgi:hypothetical protein